MNKINEGGDGFRSSIAATGGGIETLMLERTRDLEKTIARQRVLNRLLELSLQSGPLHEQLPLALDAILTVVAEGVCGAVFLREPGQDRFVLRAARHLDGEHIDLAVADRCFCGQPLEDSTASRQCARGHRLLPLQGEDGLMGVLACWPKGGAAMEPDDLRFLERAARTLTGLVQQRAM